MRTVGESMGKMRHMLPVQYIKIKKLAVMENWYVLVFIQSKTLQCRLEV